MEEKTKLDIMIALDFEWEGLEKLGVVDADKRLHFASDENVRGFVSAARLHMPPPRAPREDELKLEQIDPEQLTIEVRADRQPGSKHNRLLLIFRNNGNVPLDAANAEIGWTFDTEKALAAKSHLPGPKVVESGANIGLRRISASSESSNGSEVQFVLDEGMAEALVEVITRATEILAVQASVHIFAKFKVAETENVREALVEVAQSVIDSWEH